MFKSIFFILIFLALYCTFNFYFHFVCVCYFVAIRMVRCGYWSLPIFLTEIFTFYATKAWNFSYIIYDFFCCFHLNSRATNVPMSTWSLRVYVVINFFFFFQICFIYPFHYNNVCLNSFHLLTLPMENLLENQIFKDI